MGIPIKDMPNKKLDVKPSKINKLVARGGIEPSTFRV